jgi:tetratricopeptide (TPR) repeat protein
LSVREQRELLAKAKAAASKALAIDAALAEASAVLGMVFLFLDWNWREGELALEHALEFDPNSSYAHAYRAVLASTRLDSTRTLHELNRAVELDPLNLLLRSEAGEVCYWIQDYERAVEYASQTLELDPSYPRAHFVLGRVFESQGRIDEAIAEYEQAGMMAPGDATDARRALHQSGAAGYHRWALAAGLAAMGSLPTSGREARHAGDRAFFRARAYARLGEVDEALRYLEHAYEERECLLVLIKAQEWWDPLRSDARFQDLARRVGIP